MDHLYDHQAQRTVMLDVQFMVCSVQRYVLVHEVREHGATFPYLVYVLVVPCPGIKSSGSLIALICVPVSRK